MGREQSIDYNVRSSWDGAKFHARMLLGVPLRDESITRELAWSRLCEALYWRRVQREMEVNDAR
jgi:hypothetical protein